MRVVSGKYKGKRFQPPKNFPSRPTTDFAKERLLNILANSIDFEDIQVLDLFAGTGSISLEFLSRGTEKVLSVDKHPVAIRFLNQMQQSLDEPGWQILRRDVFAYLKQSTESFDVIFADPPFALKEILQLPELILGGGLLREEGLLVIEHGRETDFRSCKGYVETRNYGGVNFSFFQGE